MLRTIVLRVVLGAVVAGTLFVAPVVSPSSPVAATADAKAGPNYRWIVRHRARAAWLKQWREQRIRAQHLRQIQLAKRLAHHR